jgi:hypothetical protein
MFTKPILTNATISAFQHPSGIAVDISTHCICCLFCLLCHSSSPPSSRIKKEKITIFLDQWPGRSYKKEERPMVLARKIHVKGGRDYDQQKGIVY